MRVLEVRVRPGHESDFVESFKLLSAAYEKSTRTCHGWSIRRTWDAFACLPCFCLMRALKENDVLSRPRAEAREAEGDVGFDRMQQIARDAYASTESNLYAISPETSHVSKEFLDSDPDFWSPKPSADANPRATGETGEAPLRKGGKQTRSNRSRIFSRMFS
jgi:hypothetical protein